MNYIDRLRKCLKIVSKYQKYVYIVLILFFISVIVGYFDASLTPDQVFGEFSDTLTGQNYLYIAAFIFFNNVKSSFLSILFGILFFPILATVVNGYVIGSVSSYLVSKDGLTLPVIFLSLIPHGVFELPAIIISFALGLKITVSLFYGTKEVNKSYRVAFFVFFNLIVPLLFVAALIESSLFFI